MRLMDYTEIKVEMAEGGLLEPLFITEEGDETEGAAEREAASRSVAIAQSPSGESALKKEEEHAGEHKNEDDIATKMCLEDQSLEKSQANAEDGQTGEAVVNEEDKQEDDKPEETENMSDGQNRGDSESEGQTHEVTSINEKPEKPADTEGEEAKQNEPQVDIRRLKSSEQQPEGTKSQEVDPKKVCGLFVLLYHIPPCNNSHSLC